MTTRQQTFAKFYEARGVTDDKVKQALEKAAEQLSDSALTFEKLEALWYSRPVSWARHGLEHKAPQDVLADEAE